MTALPLQPPRLLSAEEFAALPEDTEAHYELQEGAVVMSPRAVIPHQRCLQRLFLALASACPEHLVVFLELDVNLELVPPGRPGFVRAPDLVVARRDSAETAESEKRILRASELELVVEILSPSTRRTDTVVKHGEYADAGIPRYWMIDQGDDEVTLTVAHLAGEFGYVNEEPARGRFATDQPFPVELDLGVMR